jgi:hypothetical protein
MPNITCNRCLSTVGTESYFCLRCVNDLDEHHNLCQRRARRGLYCSRPSHDKPHFWRQRIIENGRVVHHRKLVFRDKSIFISVQKWYPEMFERCLRTSALRTQFLRSKCRISSPTNPREIFISTRGACSQQRGGMEARAAWRSSTVPLSHPLLAHCFIVAPSPILWRKRDQQEKRWIVR